MSAETQTAVATIDTISSITPAIYTKEGGISEVCAMIEREVKGFEPNVSTATGRKEIGSIAYKIAQSKTHLSKLGKDLTKEWRDKTKIVNEDIKLMEERLSNLKDAVRKPLTDWEYAERCRVDNAKERIAEIKRFGIITDEGGEFLGSQSLENYTSLVKSINLDGMDEFAGEAANAVLEVLKTLDQAIEYAIKREKEAAELESLRKAQEEREAEEEAERKAKEYAASQEAARIAQEQREEKIRQEASRKAKDDAEKAEKYRIEKIEAAKQKEIDEINRKVAAEKEYREAKEKAEQKDQERIKKEKEDREADLLNRQRVIIEIAYGLKACGLGEHQAELAANAMAEGKIKNITVNF